MTENKAAKEQLENLSTEEKILVAARTVFTRKGYEATKTRDIAEEADINIASLHYYYRSKEKLFEIIAGEALSKISQSMDLILNNENPLHEKIRQFVPMYIDFVKHNPYLPMFIFSEMQHNADKISNRISNTATLQVLKKQLERMTAEGVIRPISLGNFMSNIIGLTVFPFMGKPIIKLKTEMNEEDFQEMLEQRKTMVPEMIINYLYYKTPQ
jgi:AcrR family transcriptional regulator